MRQKECVMCFDGEGEMMLVPCDSCESFVHGECLVSWLVRNGTCPVCRRSIMQFQDESRGGQLFLDPNFVQVANTVWEVWELLSRNNRNLLMSVAIMFFNFFLPLIFFLLDVACGVAVVSQMQAGNSISAHLCNVMSCSVILHFLSFVLHLMSLSRGAVAETRRLQMLLIFGMGMLLGVPFSNPVGVPSSPMGVPGSPKWLVSQVSDSTGLVYLGMTYVLMFLMTIPAMFHPRSIWKVNYLCERVTFVSIMCGLRDIGDTRILLALTSFTGILTSGVTLTL